MMALTRVPKLNYSQQRMLVETLGSATAVYENRRDIMDAVPDATAALKNCSLPVIFFHGDTDDYVPCQMSKINFDACPGTKELVIVPHAGHGLCYLIDPQKYIHALKNFEKHWGL